MSNSHGESLHEYIINNGVTNIKSEYIRDDKTGYKRRYRKQGNEQEMKCCTCSFDEYNKISSYYGFTDSLLCQN